MLKSKLPGFLVFSKENIVTKILSPKNPAPLLENAKSFAPANIALAKYWGKRNSELNLPMNSSLSISLDQRGATAMLTATTLQHRLTINHQNVESTTPHGRRLIDYLNLFHAITGVYYHLTLEVNIPFAAGLASSAAVFAAIIQAMNSLHQWHLSYKELSILARLGSGSAARSILQGFVEWHQGENPNGMDSFAEKIPVIWPQLCVGLCIFNVNEKPVSSREGMQRTKTTSPLYANWPHIANTAVTTLKEAIISQDFALLGRTAENNALTMHATMLSAWPPLLYSTQETLTQMQKIWQLRQDGLPIYFTQDAGPNLKILCLQKDMAEINHQFDTIEWVHPFRTE